MHTTEFFQPLQNIMVTSTSYIHFRKWPKICFSLKAQTENLARKTFGLRPNTKVEVFFGNVAKQYSDFDFDFNPLCMTINWKTFTYEGKGKKNCIQPLNLAAATKGRRLKTFNLAKTFGLWYITATYSYSFIHNCSYTIFFFLFHVNQSF